MGLTRERQAASPVFEHTTVALAGNPNVGKSSLFNKLTGSNRHTGNWTGKTVSSSARALRKKYRPRGAPEMTLVDLPGTYSLGSGSPEELEALNFIRSGSAQAVVVVCDACCLERNLILALQIIEQSPRVLLCLNLIDEARKKGIKLDIPRLESLLGIPVAAVSASTGEGLNGLTAAVADLLASDVQNRKPLLRYSPEIEEAIRDSRAEGIAALKAIADGNTDVSADFPALSAISPEYAAEELTARPVMLAEAIAGEVVSGKSGYSEFDRRLDSAVTHPIGSLLLGMLLLAGVFWLTICGSNYPSMLLQGCFDRLESGIYSWLGFLPSGIRSAIVEGMLRTLFRVVAVMLPPMAIFFPLFTLLEDSGLFARIAFNADGVMQRCGGCGKQALTMAMGLGCNAAGVTGCRIIESKRERLAAILTNNFMPCNGRFPILITISGMMFTGSGIGGTLGGAAVMSLCILVGVAATLGVTKLIRRGGESLEFRLELPPYRKPRIRQVLVRSLFDRTLFVLARAAAVAAPAGLLIWLGANISPGGVSILNRLAEAAEPFGRFIGLDGVMVIALIAGFPANEIVFPIALMIYTDQSILGGSEGIGGILSANGWTSLTYLNTLVMTVFRFPCSTTLLTIKKESDSTSLTLLSVLIPTVLGIVICIFTRLIFAML